MGLALCFFGIGAYVIGINKVMRQIKAKQNANVLVSELSQQLQEPGGCMVFLGPNFQLQSPASDEFRDANGLVNREGGQTLKAPIFSNTPLEASTLLEDYNLKVFGFKLYQSTKVDRELAQVDPAQYFQIVGYFAPAQSALEKELYPISIGEIAFPSGSKEKTCFWRE